MQTDTMIRQTQAETEQRLTGNISMKPFYMRGKSTAFIKLDTQKWVKVDFNEVTHIEANEKISILYFYNGDRLVCKNPLYKVQCMLPAGFERIHRSYIVNVQWVDFVDVGKKQVGLKTDSVLSLGLAYKDCIARYFINPSKYLTEE